MTETAANLTDRAAHLAELAIALRAEQGYNCAQAVACALAPEVGIDADTMYGSPRFWQRHGWHDRDLRRHQRGHHGIEPAGERGHRGAGHHQSCHLPSRAGARRGFPQGQHLDRLPRAQGHRHRAGACSARARGASRTPWCSAAASSTLPANVEAVHSPIQNSPVPK